MLRDGFFVSCYLAACEMPGLSRAQWPENPGPGQYAPLLCSALLLIPAKQNSPEKPPNLSLHFCNWNMQQDRLFSFSVFPAQALQTLYAYTSLLQSGFIPKETSEIPFSSRRRNLHGIIQFRGECPLSVSTIVIYILALFIDTVEITRFFSPFLFQLLYILCTFITTVPLFLRLVFSDPYLSPPRNWDDR